MYNFYDNKPEISGQMNVTEERIHYSVVYRYTGNIYGFSIFVRCR
jgi:hypothetical protein